MPKSAKDLNIAGNVEGRPMKNLGDQIQAAHLQRMRELGDLIVNKLPLLPEEMNELRNLIHAMASDTNNQRNLCFNKFAELERLIDRKMIESSEKNRKELQDLKLEVVREMTALIVEQQNSSSLVSKLEKALDNKLKWIYRGIIVSMFVGILGILEDTSLFQPILSFLLSMLKVLL